MLTYAFFLSNRREPLVRAFRKKTPLSVRQVELKKAKMGLTLMAIVFWLPFGM